MCVLSAFIYDAKRQERRAIVSRLSFLGKSIFFFQKNRAKKIQKTERRSRERGDSREEITQEQREQGLTLSEQFFFSRRRKKLRRVKSPQRSIIGAYTARAQKKEEKFYA